jgi:hypothetical protein
VATDQVGGERRQPIELPSAQRYSIARFWPLLSLQYLLGIADPVFRRLFGSRRAHLTAVKP